MKDLNRDYLPLLTVQLLIFFSQLVYLLYLFFGHLPIAIANLYVGCNLSFNLPTKLWISLVTCQPIFKFFIFLAIFIVIISITCLFYKKTNNTKFIAILSTINFIFTVFILFITTTIYTHLIQFVGVLGYPPYWPYFGK